MKSNLDLIADKAKQNINMKFTSLIHHINEENLLQCYRELKRNKACGIDGVTLEEYGNKLNENIKLLVQKLKTKEYRHKPVKRVYIPKPGKSEKRGLGIPALEDKLVQLMAKKILEPIFESKFLECSYGFRPGLSCHTAISALNQTVMKEPVNYVVEVDVRKFFDNVSHYWLLRCIEERVADPNMIWLIKRFLKAGVVEAGVYYDSEVGTPQGGIISPLLANIYLHYVLDLWFSKVILPKARDKMKMIRYCDDWLVCCANKKDAEEFLEQLKTRLNKFNLEVADDKTKIIKFGRKEWKNRKSHKEKTNSFTFLGFTQTKSAKEIN
jgi:RNA-directed DNA polymerase